MFYDMSPLWGHILWLWHDNELFDAQIYEVINHGCNITESFMISHYYEIIFHGGEFTMDNMVCHNYDVIIYYCNITMNNVMVQLLSPNSSLWYHSRQYDAHYYEIIIEQVCLHSEHYDAKNYEVKQKSWLWLTVDIKKCHNY